MWGIAAQSAGQGPVKTSSTLEVQFFCSPGTAGNRWERLGTAENR